MQRTTFTVFSTTDFLASGNIDLRPVHGDYLIKILKYELTGPWCSESEGYLKARRERKVPYVNFVWNTKQ